MRGPARGESYTQPAACKPGRSLKELPHPGVRAVGLVPADEIDGTIVRGRLGADADGQLSLGPEHEVIA